MSHFVLRTRARGAESGTEIRVNGGAVASVTEAGMPEGTSIEVADVFYNLPARRKFLKSDGAEAAQVSRIVTQLALCYPEIGFTLTRSRTEGAPVSAGGVAARPAVPALRRASRPVEVRRDGGDVKVIGYIAALAEQGPTRGPQNVFVNRRIVKDRTIAHAIIDAYSVASIKERSPEVHLFIDDAARRGGRERASDEGRGALPRSVVHPRGDSADVADDARPRSCAGAAARGAARPIGSCRRRCRCRPPTAARSRAAGRRHRQAGACRPPTTASRRTRRRAIATSAEASAAAGSTRRARRRSGR